MHVEPAAAQAERNVVIDFEVGEFNSAEGDWGIEAVNVSGDLDRGRAFTVELRDGDGHLLWAGTDEYTPPQTTIQVNQFVAVGDVEEAGIAQRRSGSSRPDPIDPVDPVDPVGPVDPVDPTDPTDPIDPVDPTDPVDPVDPTDPVGPVDPTGPPDPATQSGPTVAGDQVVNVIDQDGDGDVDEDDQVIADAEAPAEPGDPSPEVEGDVTIQDVEQLPQQGSGVGGAGQLALSMVIAVVFVAILFRAPLPAATTTRWRK